MKNSMRKTTLREIKGSFSRWIAILAICALGVGFFAGLKVCQQDCLVTGNNYLSKTNFYDYRLMSSLGLEEEDIHTIGAVSGVNLAEGAYSEDALVELVGGVSGARVMKFHTLSEKINILSVTEGRMATKDTECVVDDQHFSKSDIGRKIKLAESNDQETKDFFRHGEFTIVGVAQSPMYLNFERGTTALGNGNVAAFVYVLPEAFDSDYYTEAYVDIQSDGVIYSDEYKADVDAMEAPMTKAIKACANRRYDEIMSEANEKLADAEKKLNDGQAEIADGEQKLADAKAELISANSAYEKGVSDYQANKDAAYAQLEAQKAQIDLMVGTPEYEVYLAQYEAAKAAADTQFEEAWQQLESSKRAISRGWGDVSKSEEEIADAKAELETASAELEDAKQEVADIKRPSTYILDRESNIGYVCYNNDTSIVDSIAKVFPVFFLLVAALVCMTTMTRMIDDQRTQIGVLKALGYSKGKILWKYLFYSGSASLIGSTIGYYVGIYLFPFVIWQAYGMMYQFSDLHYVADWVLAVFSILVAVACCVGTTFFCCFHELSNVPAELIRPKAPPMGKRILLERVTFLWNRLKFLHKVCLRNIFRYKKRFFMMVLGISGCTALLLTGLGIGDSIKNIVSAQYDEIFYNDYTISFESDFDDAKRTAFVEESKGVISDLLFMTSLSVEAKSGDNVKTVNMVVCDEPDRIDKFIHLKSGDTALTYPKSGECIINSNLATNLNMKVGDTLSVFNSDMMEMKTKIVSLCDNYVNNYIYINDETYRSAWGEPDENSAFAVGVAPEGERVADPHEDGAYIMNMDGVTSVMITKDFRDRIANMMKSLDYVIALIILSAGALAFIVLYNLTNINITERVREIATIKVLGFYPRETNSYVFRENIVLTAISAAVGLPLGRLLHTFVMANIQIDLMCFDVHIATESFFIAIALTFVFALIVNLVMYFKLQKISMTESLKSIE